MPMLSDVPDVPKTLDITRFQNYQFTICVPPLLKLLCEAENFCQCYSR